MCIVHSCSLWLRPRNPPSRIWSHIRGHYWSAKIDDISLWSPAPKRGNVQLFQSYMTLYDVSPKKFRLFSTMSSLVESYRFSHYLFYLFKFMCVNFLSQCTYRNHGILLYSVYDVYTHCKSSKITEPISNSDINIPVRLQVRMYVRGRIYPL